MYRTILNPYPIRTSRVSAPYSRMANPRTVVGDVDVFRSRDVSGDTYRPSTLLSNPPQLVDPELRGGEALFPNLRVGRFGNDSLYDDNTVLRVAEMIRPDVIDMASTNPAKRAKALESIQFNKAGQSPGQAKALADLIRRKPELANSFNIGYGSSLNKEQGLAQDEGRVFEFDPTDEMWKSGFARKDPNIVQINDLQGMLLRNAELDTYQGEPLPPYATKLVYNSADRTQDINDPQLFFNPKSRANIDYQGLADAFESIPKDVTSKTGRSLRDRWDRTKDYRAFPPRGQTLVVNPDKKTQTIDEIMADVDKIESPYFSPEFADNRIQRSQSSTGNQDNNNISKDYTRKAYLEATGDSDNLPPLDYNPDNTLVELFGGIAADRNGNTFPMTRVAKPYSKVVGREFDESNAASAFTFPAETRRAYRLLKSGDAVIEDRTFLLNSPNTQLPIRASASVLPQNYYGAERNIPTGIEGIIKGFKLNNSLHPAVDLPTGYYGIERDIPTNISAIEEGLTGRKGSIVGYANAQRKQRPTTKLEREELGTDYYNPYRESYGKGETNLSDNLYLKNFSEDPNNVFSADLKWDESNPNIANYPRRIGEFYRIPGQTYNVGRRDNLPMYVTKDGEERYFKDFTSPEIVLPDYLSSRFTPEIATLSSKANTKQSPNNYRIAGSTSEVGGYNEFNEVMDEGIQASRDLDRLYPLNDELAYLSDIAKGDDMYADILGYEQSEVLDKIVDAERTAEAMGGIQRRLSGKLDQGAFEQERMAFEGRPLALTQYNVDEVLEPSFGRDYSGRTNTGRVRTAVGTNYDAGIPVGAVVKTRLANQVIDPIKLDDPEISQFNQAQYTRDMIDRGGVLIDTQLGVPIIKAPTTAYNSATQGQRLLNVGGSEVTAPKNITYVQSVRPSRVANGVANWQAPESLALGRVGRQTPIQGIPELPTDTGMTVERRASSPMAAIQRELLNNNSVSLFPWSNAPLPSRDWTTTIQGQVLYPNAGIGPINTGLKPKPTIGELFGFTALTPEGLAKYRDME